MLREDQDHLVNNYTSLLYLLRTTGDSLESDFEERLRMVEENFENLVEEAKANHENDIGKETYGAELIKKWESWFTKENGDIPEFLLPAKVPGGNSTTAATLMLASAGYFAGAVVYKSPSQLVAEAQQVRLRFALMGSMLFRTDDWRLRVALAGCQNRERKSCQEQQHGDPEHGDVQKVHGRDTRRRGLTVDRSDTLEG